MESTMQAIDSAILWPDNTIYFFRGRTYLEYSVAKDQVLTGIPVPVGGNLRGLQDVQRFQGAVAWPNGKAYFFDGDHYYRYDIKEKKADDGSPFPTLPNWRGVIPGPNRSSEIHAAFLWPNGFGYLFQDNQYYKFNVADDKVEAGYPKLISEGWPGLASSGQQFVAAFVWPELIEGRQKAFFFHHTIYYRYDVADDHIDPGYPLNIEGNWKGL